LAGAAFPPLLSHLRGAQMTTEILNVDLPEELYIEFIETVTDKKGRWREQESIIEAVNSAATAALVLFLRGLDGEHRLPEFGDYAREKYPEMDEGLISRIEDLIERERQYFRR
jgi:hypothetical protein